MKNLRSSYPEGCKVDEETYCQILYKFMRFIMKSVFDGETISLPSGMGFLSVEGKKQKPKIDDNGHITGLAPDWVKTKQNWLANPEAGKRKDIIYHFNEHTNGVRYKILWSKKKILATNKTLYALIFTRTNKRNLVALIKGGKEYLIK